MANANLKAAANNIRNAAQDKQRKIDELRYLVQRKEQATKRDIDSKQSSLRERTEEVVRIQTDPDRDDREGVEQKRAVRDLQRAISEEERALRDEQQQLFQDIRNLEQQIAQLNNQAKDLEFRD